LNSEKIWKISKKSEKIGKIQKKIGNRYGKYGRNCEVTWKIWKKKEVE
jgi:hypothetical protein